MRQFKVKSMRVKNEKELLELIKDQKFVIYGGGWLGYAFIKTFYGKYKVFPEFVIDKRAGEGNKLLGIPAISPDKVFKKIKSCIAIITMAKEDYIKEVEKFLKSIGFTKVVKFGKQFVKTLTIETIKNQYFSKPSDLEKKKKKLSTTPEDAVIKLPENSYIFHIGWGKTGSTSIQLSLWGWKHKKFLYPQFEWFDHNFLALIDYKSLIKIPVFKVIPYQMVKKAKFENFFQFVKYIKKFSEKKIFILSSEMVTLVSYRYLRFIQNFLSLFFKSGIIFGYIREPYSFITSTYQQWLKDAFLPLSELEKCYFGYRRNFEKFFKVFGKKNVILKKFDPSRFPDGCVVKDFCQTFGIPLSEDRIIRANVSLPKEVISAVYLLRKYSKLKLTSTEVLFLKDLFEEILPEDYKFTSFKISKEVIKPIVEKHKEDIKWMEEVLGEPLITEKALKEPDPDYSIKKEEDLFVLPDELIEALSLYTGIKVKSKKPEDLSKVLRVVILENFIV